MPRQTSRISRVEEQRATRRFYFIVAVIIAIIIILVAIGVPVLIRVSAFLDRGQTSSNTNQDTTAPFAPTLSPILNATNSAQLKVDGYAEPESTLKLFLNDSEEKNVIVGTDGEFEFNDLTLKSGENQIYATATDTSGNESAPSRTLTIMFKKGALKLEVSEPSDGAEFGRNNQEITIKGKTDEGNQVWVNDRFVSVRDDGSFEHQFRLNDGDNNLHFVAQDAAGNQTTVDRKVKFNP